MMNATYMSLNGEAISFDLDAAAGIARGFSTRRPSWSATLVYDLKNSAFIELRSSPQDIRGYSKGECEEVGALYIQKTFSIAEADLAAIKKNPSAWRIKSEERRVGKEWVSTGRSRWTPDHKKK